MSEESIVSEAGPFFLLSRRPAAPRTGLTFSHLFPQDKAAPFKVCRHAKGEAENSSVLVFMTRSPKDGGDGSHFEGE